MFRFTILGFHLPKKGPVTFDLSLKSIRFSEIAKSQKSRTVPKSFKNAYQNSQDSPLVDTRVVLSLQKRAMRASVRACRVCVSCASRKPVERRVPNVSLEGNHVPE